MESAVARVKQFYRGPSNLPTYVPTCQFRYTKGARAWSHESGFASTTCTYVTCTTRAIYTCVRLQQHAVHAREAGASRAWATMVPRVGHLPEGSARKGNVQGCCAARFRPDRWLLAVSTLTALRFLHL
jgi:hypothetical protein